MSDGCAYTRDALASCRCTNTRRTPSRSTPRRKKTRPADVSTVASLSDDGANADREDFNRPLPPIKPRVKTMADTGEGGDNVREGGDILLAPFFRFCVS